MQNMVAFTVILPHMPQCCSEPFPPSSTQPSLRYSPTVHASQGFQINSLIQSIYGGNIFIGSRLWTVTFQRLFLCVPNLLYFVNISSVIANIYMYYIYIYRERLYLHSQKLFIIGYTIDLFIQLAQVFFELF